MTHEEIPELCHETFVAKDNYSKDTVNNIKWLVGGAAILVLTATSWAIATSVEVGRLKDKVDAQSEIIQTVTQQNIQVLKKLDNLELLLTDQK